MQRNGIFSGCYAPLTYYVEAIRNTLMARNAWEICHFFAHLYRFTTTTEGAPGYDDDCRLHVSISCMR